MTSLLDTPPDVASPEPEAPQRHAAQRGRILDAALAEFAERGFAGARVDAIAERSGINKRLIYAYVGNKEALWLAVLERVYEEMRLKERALDLMRLEPEDGMVALVRFNFRYHADHPEFLALLNDENLQRGRNLQRSTRVREMYSPLLAMLGDLLARGEAKGVFRPGVDPMQLYISIAALSYFYCSNIHTLSAIFGRPLAAPDEMRTREQHVVAVVMGYLRAA
ncbi:TetR family transcriptional regulator [Aliidongia dinghuensis]|uniref:TetR family transcriptional regulator n=1 Tax=Aliidongia dinghuensis TaxID=1867774 RepID=A0A8J2YS62_9PROT|nr:TetR/AcrR family transcriptional regulator [Aliidongia dinghuensis]GGF11291.1 TetR family transcriptional regulator [Aliidongia dinghuensis]